MIFKGFENKYEIIDLSNQIQRRMPRYFSHPPFSLNVWTSKQFGDATNFNMIVGGEHCGTHVDASLHFFDKTEGGKSIEEYSIDNFIGSCVRLLFPESTSETLITVEQIKSQEQEDDPIKEGDIVLFYFGWGKYFNDLSDQKRFLDDWPGLSKEAAEYLVEKGVKMVGCDTLAIDATKTMLTREYPAHNVLLENEVLITECLANIDKLPYRSFYFGVPLNLKDGTGCPIRAFAVVGSEQK
ncbi:MAG TPA: cyclase family protein [Clostridiaceae bacterium]|jgi:kynurenine formamidase|nr:cyclase family protein [Clostridiaceae bacterium]